MKVLVFLKENRLSPRGGPYAVGYYLREERDKKGDTFIEFLPKDEEYERVHENGRKITSKLPAWFNNFQRSVRRIRRNDRLINGEPARGTFDFSEYDIVHFHEASDLYAQRGNLENYKGVVVLTSHTPVPFHQEHFSDLPKLETKLFPKVYGRTVLIDRYAFERADYVIFPCEEAEEPYFDNWDEFAAIKDKKKDHFRYVLTGIPCAAAKRGRAEVRKELGISEDEFVVNYVGRHNTVKGYAKLLEIGKKALDKWADVRVVCAGRETPMTGLKHERWTEIGWTTEPHSYIGAADVFVLPNLATYFDIVMLEVLSLGCIVIASRTGGNKWFEKQGVEGVFLYDTVDEAVELIGKIKALPAEERARLGQANKDFYSTHLTAKAMYEQYVGVLEDVYSDFYKK